MPWRIDESSSTTRILRCLSIGPFPPLYKEARFLVINEHGVIVLQRLRFASLERDRPGQFVARIDAVNALFAKLAFWRIIGFDQFTREAAPDDQFNVVLAMIGHGQLAADGCLSEIISANEDDLPLSLVLGLDA